MKSYLTPRSLGSKLYVLFSGICMGAADVVPGVSGGTMAFILGVYEDLLEAIHRFDVRLIRDICQRRFREAFGRIPWQFLILLVGGIAASVFALAETIEHLYENEQVLLFAFFFGLIVASVRVLAGGVAWNAARFGCLAVGILVGWLMVTLTPNAMPQTMPVLFFSGAVAIMAMILPGISGSFLLLILGQYLWVMSQIRAIRQALSALEFAEVFRLGLGLLPLALGAVFGLLSFARLLRWILQRRHNAMVAVLIGFMIGSLRKIWPWREPTLTEIIDDKPVVLADRLSPPGEQMLPALGLMLLGVALILGLEAFQRRKASASPLV